MEDWEVSSDIMAEAEATWFIGKCLGLSARRDDSSILNLILGWEHAIQMERAETGFNL